MVDFIWDLWLILRIKLITQKITKKLFDKSKKLIHNVNRFQKKSSYLATSQTKTLLIILYMQSMSIAKKFFSALGVLVIASSVVPSTSVSAQDGTTVMGRSTNFVFCEGPVVAATVATNSAAVVTAQAALVAAQNATPQVPATIATAQTALTTAQTALTNSTSRQTSAQASFDKNGVIYFARNTRAASSTYDASKGLNFNGSCQETSTISSMPILARHSTSFDLNGSTFADAAVSNVRLTNTVPMPVSTTICVASGSDAVVNFVDAEKDTMTLVPYDLSDTSASAVQSGNSIRVTSPTADYVGKISMRVGVLDSTMTRIANGGTITPGGYSYDQISVNPSGIREANVNVTVEFSKNCPAMVSSMSSSMMSSSMSSMSSSMMSSSMDSSMMSSSMNSSKSSMMSSTPVVVYVEVPVSGKGTTIRTGANN